VFKSPSTKQKLLNFAGWTAFLAATFGTWQFVGSVLGQDALASYRTPDLFKKEEGIIIKNFQIKSYQGDRLVTEALVDEATVWKDRSTIQLVGIKSGKFYNSDKKEYLFTAGQAEYGTYAKSILASNGVRLWDKSMDLKSVGFLYDHAAQRVSINGDVTGKIEKGDLVSKDVMILLDTNEIRTGAFNWKGPLKIEGQNLKPWNVQAKKTSLKNNLWTYVDARGEDSDTIVKADKMTWDRKADVVVGEGNVEYFGIDANVSCDKIVIERKIGKATLTGKVVNMLIKPEDTAPKETGIPPVVPIVPDSVAANRPKPQGQDDPVRSQDNLRQYPIVMRAGQIEYWYRKGERHAILTKDPFARQELGAMQWRELEANRVEYDGEKEILVLRSTLSQLVKMRNSIGDDMTATFLQVSTKKGDDEMEGENMKGTMMIDPNDLPEKPGGGGNSGGGGTTGSTGTTGGGSSIRGKIGG
jgi:lipopolysaccharide export system protein LptA